MMVIKSDVFPDPRFYQRSVDELLAAGEPFVFTIYSPAFCPTTACGPLLRYMKEIANEFPTMTFVHAEPYVMRDLGGRIQPEYEGGRYAWATWSEAYGIPVEPFVFVVDGSGTIVASFELIVGSDEIRAAIDAYAHAGVGELIIADYNHTPQSRVAALQRLRREVLNG